jgi:hypothetical protein
MAKKAYYKTLGLNPTAGNRRTSFCLNIKISATNLDFIFVKD